MSGKIMEQIVAGIRRVVALQLWQLSAIKVNLDEPFKLVSGNYSPIYINCRQLISSPAFADLFAAAARMICEQRKITFDVVAGGETAGIPFAAFLARAFGCPMVYVRKEVKGHGLASRVEGALDAGACVLLVEDLITDAGSKLSFIEALRATGAAVEDALVVFDRLQGGKQALVEEGVRLHALTNMDMALAEAESAGRLTCGQRQSVREYLDSPRNWHVKHGLAFMEKQ